MSIRGGEEKAPRVSRGFFLLPSAFVVFLDQLSKAIALVSLEPGESYPVLPRIFHFTLVENQGIAFGLFQGFEKIIFVLITVSIAVLVAIGLRSEPYRFRIHLALGLILGGAVGNWIDRLRTGAVIDFLDFRVWPVFNLADSAITIGVAIFLFHFLMERKRVS